MVTRIQIPLKTTPMPVEVAEAAFIESMQQCSFPLLDTAISTVKEGLRNVEENDGQQAEPEMIHLFCIALLLRFAHRGWSQDYENAFTYLSKWRNEASWLRRSLVCVNAYGNIYSDISQGNKDSVRNEDLITLANKHISNFHDSVSLPDLDKSIILCTDILEKQSE